MFEKVKDLLGFTQSKISFIQSFMVALITGLIASTLTNPFEVPKLRMQV